jgi:Bacterial membrane protein YfhO
MAIDTIPEPTSINEIKGDEASRPKRQRHMQILIVMALVLLPLIYFFPAVIGKVTLTTGDSWSYSILMRILVGQMLADGEIPLWNPYTFAGMPLLAALQAGVFYPPNWLFVLLPPGAAMKLVVISVYQVALIGSYIYARALNMGRAAALVTGITFAFGGFMIDHLEQVNFIAAAAWLPWVLWAIEKIHQSRQSRSWRESWRWAGAGAVVICLQLFAGLPQATWHILLVGGAYFLFLLARREETEVGGRLRFTAATAVMAVCGALLSAIQLLPARELQRQGERASIDYETFSTFSMAPRFWLSTIFPFFYGGGLPPYQVGGWDHWWLHKWAHGYVGMLGLLLALVALFAYRRRGLVWFWSGVAICAMIMAAGDNLPFGLNRALYHVPVYNLFRGSYRHTYEFTFALAVLAGLGVTSLEGFKWERIRPVFWRASLTLAVVVAGVAAVYRFGGHLMGAASKAAAGANHLTNYEALAPLSMFGLSLIVLWLYARRRTTLTGMALLAVLTLDLASFGWFTYWRITSPEILNRLPDPPAAQAIKARESGLLTFRVVSHAMWPYNHNYELLNHANLSIARGLQSVSGYDPMRLPRPAALAGEMDIFGVIRDANVFGAFDQGLNLLNVKYLLRERPAVIDEKLEPVVTHDGIRFKNIVTEFKLGPGQRLEFDTGGDPMTELAMVTTLTNSTHFPDGAPVSKIKLHTTDGRVIERELQAGRDTAEWAYDRADVRAAVKHRLPRVVESWPVADFEAHRYLARLAFDRAGVERIEMDYLRPDGGLVIIRAALFDSISGKSAPVETSTLSTERWRRLASFGEIDLYQNLKALPRAWFVERALALPSREVLQAIKRGKLPDGAPFDPAKVALLDEEDFGGREVSLPATGVGAGAEARVTRYEPRRIELMTRNEQPGFLILSEVYYRGWDARVDGVKRPVERVNYTLRGIALPAGEHRVEFVFRAPSFRTGAIYSGIGALILVAGAMITRRRASKDKLNL